MLVEGKQGEASCSHEAGCDISDVCGAPAPSNTPATSRLSVFGLDVANSDVRSFDTILTSSPVRSNKYTQHTTHGAQRKKTSC